MASAFALLPLALLFVAVPAHAQDGEEPQDPATNTVPEDATPSEGSVPPAPSVDLLSLPIPDPPASRAPTPPSDPITPRESTRWYGWQTVIVDGASVALLFPAAASKNAGLQSTLLTASVGGYFLGAPFVHALHGSPGRALGSLGLRVGAPLVGIALGSSLENCQNDSEEPNYCGFSGAVIGGVVGILSAIVIDSAALARETVHEQPKLTPMVGSTKGRTWIGVAGQF